MSMERSFFKRNLEAAEADGDENQQDRMADLVVTNAHLINELGEIIGGRRRQRNHPHHRPADLVNAVITGVTAITNLRREIDEKKPK